jgi:hypothetical protein
MNSCGDDLESALACLRSYAPDVRIIGNVRAITLINLLQRSPDSFVSIEMYQECRYQRDMAEKRLCEVEQAFAVFIVDQWRHAADEGYVGSFALFCNEMGFRLSPEVMAAAKECVNE